MSKLAEFFYGSGNQLSMMRLITFISSVGALILIAVYPEQAVPLSTVIVSAHGFKWAQSKGGE